MVATIAAGTAAGYYLAQSEYYLGGSEPPGQWIAAGHGLGIAPENAVERDLFERLHAALDEHGRPLLTNGGRIDRVPGYDVTFSAPKSVSVLWGLVDVPLRQEIESAQAKAVKAAIALLERNAAWSRRGHGGTRSEKVKLSVAAFQHGEARPAVHEDGSIFADPQLHTHAVILNLAQREDGTIGTLDGRRLFAWKMAAGAAYHLELASQFQALGLTICDIGKNGTFEIEGVDVDISRYFSARRGEVEALLDEAGAASATAPALAATIAKTSRSAKSTSAGADRHVQWRERAAAQGLEANRLAEEVLEAGRLESENIVDLAAPAWRERLKALMGELTQNESYFDRRQLMAATATALVGSGRMPAEAEDEADRLLADGIIVELRADTIGERRYSTPDMIRVEREVLAMATRLAASDARRPDLDLLSQLATEHGLSGEQTDAILSVSRQGRVAVMEGAAGSGKSTTLLPLVRAWQAAGCTVIGSATAWRIANQLGADLGIDARATDSWIARGKAGKSFADANTVMIVDEAGQLSSRQMHALLSEAGQSGASLVLVGDRRQLQPVGAGGALSIVARAVEVAEVRRVVRQRDPWARSAVMALAEGRTASALKAYERNGQLYYGETQRATIETLVDAAEAAKLSEPASPPLIMARTNAEARRINAEIRKRRLERGLLWGDEVILPAVTPSGHSHDLPLAAGDEIRFLIRDGSLGVVNGTVATLVSVERHESDMMLAARIGEREVEFAAAELADELGRVRLGHAYASTIYGAQGLTTETALVLLDPLADRHDTYVALSRARGATRVFVDRKGVDAAMRDSRQLSRRDAENEVTDEDRTRWLGRQLSRASIKGTTLDLVQTGEAAAKDRSRQTSHERRVPALEVER
ncbi:MAG: MobF family relaxase [Rhizobiaceae bacterium]